MSNYNEITALSQREQIRLRPGMYIGSVDSNEYSSALMNLVREVVSNSVDEFMNGHLSQITLHLSQDRKTVSIADNGRGIPIDRHPTLNMSKLEVACSVPNSGAKYDKGEGKSFKFAGGLNGIGLKAVNYVSEKFSVVSVRDGHVLGLEFSHGVRVTEFVPLFDIHEVFREEHGTLVTFTPDPTIFKCDMLYSPDLIRRYLHQVAYLNAGLKIVFDYQGVQEQFYEPEGITALLKSRIPDSANILFQPIIISDKTEEGNQYSITLSITDGSGESFSNYVNGLEIDSSSDPVVCTRQAIAKSLSTYIETIYNPNNRHKATNLETSDIRSGVYAVIKFLHIDPSFDSQTKTRLTSKDLGRHISATLPQLLLIEFQRNMQATNTVVLHISRQAEARRAAEDARKKTLSISKKMAEDVSNISLDIYTPPSRPDDVEQNSLYLFEGLSASAALIKASKFINPETNRPYKDHIGILALQGLVLQSLEEDLSRVMQNKELSTLIKVSGLNPKSPDDLSGLRFNRFIVSSDMDFAGSQITMLMVCFFATHFPEVIRQGKLFRLETPFYSIIDTKTKEYDFVFSDRTIEQALSSRNISQTDLQKKRFVVQRNKGLGELDSVEVRTMVENPRLIPITAQNFDLLKSLLYIFAGKNNVSDRKNLMFELGLNNL